MKDSSLEIVDGQTREGWRRSAVSLLSDLTKMIVSWWNVDRIRIPTREGQLLRLDPSTILWIEGRFVTITKRIVGETACGPYVCYECLSEETYAELWLSLEQYRAASEVWWSQGESIRRLHEGEIAIYHPQRLLKRS